MAFESQRAPIIAVVDDQESIRLAIGSLLRALDLDVVAFASGDEILRWPHVGSLACVVLDVNGPGIHGFEVLRQLLARDQRLPVILISADDEPDARAKAFEAGALAYLSKPFPERCLLDSLHLALNPNSPEPDELSEPRNAPE